MTLRPLPDSEVALLRDLRHDLPALRFRCNLLQRAGWSLSEIAKASGGSRSSVQHWVADFPRKARPGDPPAPAAPDYPSSRVARARAIPRTRRASATPAEISELAELVPLARRNRHRTPTDSAFSRASVRLDALLLEMSERGVRQADIASAAGLATQSVQVRIARTRRAAAR